MNFYNKHYIQTDEQNNIIYGFSDAFEEPCGNDICIKQQGERQFELLGVYNPLLVDLNGKYLYKWDRNEVVCNA